MAKFILLIAFIGSLIGCTETDRSKIDAIGKPGEITCYSGGKEIYHGFSTGKIQNAHKSDGYEFVDASTRHLIRISADCIVKN